MSKNIRANTIGELMQKLSNLDNDTPIDYGYYAMVVDDNGISLMENSFGVPDDEL